MRSSHLLVGVVIICTGMLIGCNTKTEETKSKSIVSQDSSAETKMLIENVARASEVVYTMQVGHAQATTDPRHLSLLKFKADVEKRTNGEVVIEIYPAGQLGNEEEMTEAVKMGMIQGICGGQDEYLPEMSNFSLPFLYDDYEEVVEVFSSDMMHEVVKKVENHGLMVLAVGDAGGFRQITNNVRPIKSPADMKGLKMRTSIDIIEKSMKAFGATTVTVPFTDLYMALKTGVADGQENPLTFIESMKFYEVQKYCTIIDYMISPVAFYINLEWFQSLPKEYQTILMDCGVDMMEENSRLIAENEGRLLETIGQYCDVYTLNEDEREQFKELAKDVWKNYVAEGYMTQEELDKILVIVED